MKDTCCACQKSIDLCKEWCYMPCQHGICFRCLKKIVLNKSKNSVRYIVRCPICGCKWHGRFRDYKNTYNDEIILKENTNIEIFTPLLKKIYKISSQVISSGILFYLLLTSVYSSAIMVVFTGIIVNMFGATKGEKWWLASTMLFVSIFTYDWKPLWFGFLWDITLTYKPWIGIRGSDRILFT